MLCLRRLGTDCRNNVQHAGRRRIFSRIRYAARRRFLPAALLPKGKIATLGLSLDKQPELESTDALGRRIDEAAKYCPIEQLALSSKCGFSSVARRGARVTMDQVEAKLARMVETGQQVWG